MKMEYLRLKYNQNLHPMQQHQQRQQLQYQYQQQMQPQNSALPQPQLPSHIANTIPVGQQQQYLQYYQQQQTNPSFPISKSPRIDIQAQNIDNVSPSRPPARGHARTSSKTNIMIPISGGGGKALFCGCCACDKVCCCGTCICC